MPEKFFDETTEQSQVKTRIVSKYFWVWAKVMLGAGADKIAYLDLFAGPGRYKDGTQSTPLRILKQAIKDPDLSQKLVTLFNDKDHSSELDAAIKKLPQIKKLKYEPQVDDGEVGTEMVKMFEEMSLIPTFFFVDPWGYKGLSLELVNSVVKNWGCDCVFFFNYNRINAGLNNPAVKEHMDALFGDEADALRKRIQPLTPPDRELAIVEALCEALNPNDDRYVLPFGFKNDKGTRTSHHLIFVTKHVLGHKIMKGIMATESSSQEQGVPTFEYAPADKRYPLLFELSRPLDDLEDMLLEEFAGQTLRMKQIFDQHNVGRRYVSANYKKVLKKLEADKRIKTDPPAKERRKNSFADRVEVTFPKKLRRR